MTLKNKQPHGQGGIPNNLQANYSNSFDAINSFNDIMAKAGVAYNANAPDGRRNKTLNREAWSLARFIDSDELHPKEIVIVLSVGPSRQEIINTIASALRSKGV